MTKLKNRDLKLAEIKALRDLDYTVKEVADLLGISERTVYRLSREELDEEWQKSVSIIKRLVAVKEEQVASKALAMIEEKMPRAQFRELVGLYKVIREIQIGRMPSVANQINIDGERVTFKISRGE